MPVLDSLAGVVVTTEFDTGAKQGRATFAVEAATELFGHALEPGGRDRRQIALGQLGFEPAQLFRDGFEAFLFRGESVVHKILPLDVAQVSDEMLVLAAPVDEGALGDAELPGDACEADASGTQLDEFPSLIVPFRWSPLGFFLHG